MAADNKLELVVEIDTNRANASIKSVNSSLSTMPSARSAVVRPVTGGGTEPRLPIIPTPDPLMRSFHGTADVPAATAKMRLVQIAEEIVAVLLQDPNASIKVVVEISAEFPGGAKESVKRSVSENARILGLKAADWE